MPPVSEIIKHEIMKMRDKLPAIIFRAGAPTWLPASDHANMLIGYCDSGIWGYLQIGGERLSHDVAR